MSIFDFLTVVFSNRIFMIVSILILGVVFVNGWTDAPGAITASVSTGALEMKQAAILAAAFNFLGALIMGIFNTSVMKSIGEITMLIGNDENSIIVLCASMLSIILWATIAWYFGIPTSESHALISGVLGGALAIGCDITPHSLNALGLALIGLVFSLPTGFLMGLFFLKITKFAFK